GRRLVRVTVDLSGCGTAVVQLRIFFFQAEDGIRAFHVTGVQTCALPIFISPCASHTLRNWPAERYAQLADHAIEAHGMKVILVGSPAPFEAEYCAAIENTMKHKAHNICGQDTLKQLTALMTHADLVVAPDTG